MKRKSKLTIGSLISAARKGDFSKIRACLSSGVNINAVAGGIASNCALGGAAGKGLHDVVKALLEAGADPNNPLLPKHATSPLDWAVFSRNVECVRLLLEAGANVNRLGGDNETALDAAKIYNNRSIIDVLTKHGGKTGRDSGIQPATKTPHWESTSEEEAEVMNLSHEANSPSFAKYVTRVETISGVSREAVATIKGACSFPMSNQRAHEVLKQEFQRALDSGFFLFRAIPSGTKDNQRLMLIPTKDWAIAVRGLRTNGANQGLIPSEIVRWLKKLEKHQPFVLDGIGFDFLEGRFTTAIENANQLARDIYDFCPDVVDQGTETISRLATDLKKSRRLFLWWD